MTNADKIRAMTDEELVKHIVCEYQICERDELDCNSCILDWLKQEVSE